MKSKASYFSFSGALIGRNLRQFWALPAIAFLIYFLSSVFPMLIYHNRLGGMADYVRMCLTNMQPFFMIAHLCIPIAAAVVVFRYLQSIPAATTMHSLPFTRAQLFNSSVVSGLIMTWAPILVNGLLLFLIKKPVVPWGTQIGSLSAEEAVNSLSAGELASINIFTGTAVLNWICTSLLLVAVIYIISVFAGIVTGTSLLHLTSAVSFNFLAPLLYGALVLYFVMFLYGFNSSGNWGSIMAILSPFSGIIRSAGQFSTGQIIGYLITFVCILILSAVLYQKRKMERAGDAMAFGFMEPIISYLIAFFGMTAMGFYFSSLGNSQTDTANSFTYVGFTVGAVIFFVIGRMIVKKSSRIFNGGSLKAFGVYAVIAVLFLTALNFDATGFERRVPSPTSVDGAEFTGHNSSSIFNDYMKESTTYKNPTNITAIAAFHESIVENKKRFLQNETIRKLYLELDYKKSGVQKLTRAYHVDYNFFLESPHMKELYESEEYRNSIAPSTLMTDGVSSVSLTSSKDSHQLNREGDGNFQELLNVYEEDIRAMSFEDIMSAKMPYANIYVEYYYQDKTQPRTQNSYRAMEYQVTPACTRTIGWLKENGYWDRLVVSADDIESVTIYASTYETVQAGTAANVSTSSREIMVVRDKEQIRRLLEDADSFVIDESSYYYGEVRFADSAGNENGDEMAVYSEDFYMKDFAIEAKSTGSSILYFNNELNFLKK